MKEYRELIQVDGDFYRLLSPFEGNETAWMVVSQDKTQAVAALYQRLNKVNASWLRLKLEGLDPDAKYQVSCDLTPSSSFDTELAKRYGYDTEGNQVKTYEAYGDELMRAGIPVDRQELNKKGGDLLPYCIQLRKWIDKNETCIRLYQFCQIPCSGRSAKGFGRPMSDLLWLGILRTRPQIWSEYAYDLRVAYYQEWQGNTGDS